MTETRKLTKLSTIDEPSDRFVKTRQIPQRNSKKKKKTESAHHFLLENYSVNKPMPNNFEEMRKNEKTMEEHESN